MCNQKINSNFKVVEPLIVCVNFNRVTFLFQLGIDMADWRSLQVLSKTIFGVCVCVDMDKHYHTQDV